MRPSTREGSKSSSRVRVLGGNLLGSIHSRIDVIETALSETGVEEPFIEDSLLSGSPEPRPHLVDGGEAEALEELRPELEREPLPSVVTARIVFSLQDDHPTTFCMARTRPELSGTDPR